MQESVTFVSVGENMNEKMFGTILWDPLNGVSYQS